jgi:hypothetical protein
MQIVDSKLGENSYNDLGNASSSDEKFRIIQKSIDKLSKQIKENYTNTNEIKHRIINKNSEIEYTFTDNMKKFDKIENKLTLLKNATDHLASSSSLISHPTPILHDQFALPNQLVHASEPDLHKNQNEMSPTSKDLMANKVDNLEKEIKEMKDSNIFEEKVQKIEEKIAKISIKQEIFYRRIQKITMYIKFINLIDRHNRSHLNEPFFEFKKILIDKSQQISKIQHSPQLANTKIRSTLDIRKSSMPNANLNNTELVESGTQVRNPNIHTYKTKPKIIINFQTLEYTSSSKTKQSIIQYYKKCI